MGAAPMKSRGGFSLRSLGRETAGVGGGQQGWNSGQQLERETAGVTGLEFGTAAEVSSLDLKFEFKFHYSLSPVKASTKGI